MFDIYVSEKQRGIHRIQQRPDLSSVRFNLLMRRACKLQWKSLALDGTVLVGARVSADLCSCDVQLRIRMMCDDHVSIGVAGRCQQRRRITKRLPSRTGEKMRRKCRCNVTDCWIPSTEMPVRKYGR